MKYHRFTPTRGLFILFALPFVAIAVFAAAHNLPDRWPQVSAIASDVVDRLAPIVSLWRGQDAAGHAENATGANPNSGASAPLPLSTAGSNSLPFSRPVAANRVPSLATHPGARAQEFAAVSKSTGVAAQRIPVAPAGVVVPPPQTYTFSTTTTDPTWTNPSNWTGGVPGKFPGDGNGIVANEGSATDIAFFGGGNPTTLFNLGIDFAALNGSLTLGAIRTSSSVFVRFGNSSTAAGQTSAVLAFTGQTINGIPNTILNTEGSSELRIAMLQNNSAATFPMSIALASGTDNVFQNNGSSTIRVQTVITGSGSNVIIGGSGTGTVNFEGSTSNTYNGTTTINNSILDLAKANAIAIAGDMVIGDGVGRDIVRLNGPTLGNQIADTSILTFNGTDTNAGTLRMNAKNETVGGLVSTGGAGVIENGGPVGVTPILTVNVNGTARDFAGIVQDGGTAALGFTKSGNAAQTLSGTVANTYTAKTTVNSGTLTLNKTAGVTAISSTGATGSTLGIPNTDLQINTGGTVQLAANNQIADTTKVALSGGTLNLNGFSEGSAGVTGIGALTLTANSTIDFGMGALSVIQFAGVNGHLNNAIFQIINWTGLPNVGGVGDRLLFAGTPTDFSNVYPQSQVMFNGAAGYDTMDYGGYYEVFAVTPVPEPGTWAAGALAAAVLARRLFGRRTKRKQRR